jgi:hypothetical protein
VVLRTEYQQKKSTNHPFADTEVQYDDDDDDDDVEDLLKNNQSLKSCQ